MNLMLVTDYDTKSAVMINLSHVVYIRQESETPTGLYSEGTEPVTTFYFQRHIPLRVYGKIENVMRRYK
jgi:hypothetical protein